MGWIELKADVGGACALPSRVSVRCCRYRLSTATSLVDIASRFSLAGILKAETSHTTLLHETFTSSTHCTGQDMTPIRRLDNQCHWVVKAGRPSRMLLT